MKKFLARLLVIIAIIAAIVAALVFFGAFAIGSAGYTMMTEFGLTTLAGTLASSGAAWFVGGLAGLSLLSAYIIDSEEASRVVDKVTNSVTDVVDSAGDILSSLAKQTTKTIGGFVDGMPSWLKIGALLAGGFLLLRFTNNSDNNMIHYRVSPTPSVTHEAEREEDIIIIEEPRNGEDHG